jgi:2-polyprenyl-3-methyl-5-hydroxy-6-metoxy-1,4-benzoquinol methylase
MNETMDNPQSTKRIEQAAASLFDAKAGSWADKYDTSLSPRLSVFRAAALRFVPAAGRVIDFGCGAGVIALALAQAGYRVKGLDISADMIAAAKSRAEQSKLSVDFAVGDTQTFANLDSDFDAVVSSSVLEYLPDPVQALGEMARRIRPGGHVILSVPNSQSITRIFERVLRFPSPLARTLPLPKKIARYIQYLILSKNHFSAARFRAICQTAQLSVVEHQYLLSERTFSGLAASLRSPMHFFVLERSSR